jgi:hypothetical protein
MRQHLAREEAEPPIERVKRFLLGTLSNADGLVEVAASLRSLAERNTRSIHLDLAALEAVLADPINQNELPRLVGWHGNWVLDDPSNEGARRFLEGIVQMLRDVLDSAPDRWRGAHDLRAARS